MSAKLLIQNGNVFRDDKTFAVQDLMIEDGVLTAPAEADSSTRVLDASGLYVLPGLIDIHSHGAVGYDFSDGDPEGLLSILEYQYSQGITSYCPTSMTLPRKQLEHIFACAAKLPDGGKHAHIAGFNMEGPFLDPDKKGAHKKEYIADPDVDFFRACNAACGNQIKLVTLAPNQPGAMEFIQALKDETHISLGHTSADYEAARLALDAGADHVTHLFNAMMSLSHRAPGLIGAAAETPGCYAELICDGIHIHESAVRAAFHMFPERIVLISDSMRAAGMEDGTYDLGGQQVTVQGKLATLADGTIAGSVTNLFAGMRTAISFGIAAEDAVAAATMNPAKSIGIYDQAGSLTPGKRADVLLVDADWNLVTVLSGSNPVL